MDLGLRGKVVVVTGASEGLGAAAARRLSDEGARLALCARRDAPLQSFAKALGGEVFAQAADVTTAADVERFIGATLERFGRIDGVLNNAGAAAGQPFEKIDDAAWEADLALKVVGASRVLRLALP